eukprot:364719-Chlamydomonas_euryale.AAC.4
MPAAEDLMEKLHGACYFSKGGSTDRPDLASAHHQIRVKEADVKNVAGRQSIGQLQPMRPIDMQVSSLCATLTAQPKSSSRVGANQTTLQLELCNMQACSVYRICAELASLWSVHPAVHNCFLMDADLLRGCMNPVQNTAHSSHVGNRVEEWAVFCNCGRLDNSTNHMI